MIRPDSPWRLTPREWLQVLAGAVVLIATACTLWALLMVAETAVAG